MNMRGPGLVYAKRIVRGDPVAFLVYVPEPVLPGQIVRTVNTDGSYWDDEHVGEWLVSVEHVTHDQERYTDTYRREYPVEVVR
jgi:hypothetical protein